MNDTDSNDTSATFHDLAIVIGLPFLVAVPLGTCAYLLLLEKVSKHLPVLQQISYDNKMFWWIVVIDTLLTLCFAGHLTAYVWRKEQKFGHPPPPLRMIRKWGLLFCWSDNLTHVFSAIVPEMPRFPKFSRRSTKLPQAVRAKTPAPAMFRMPPMPKFPALPKFSSWVRALKPKSRKPFAYPTAPTAVPVAAVSVAVPKPAPVSARRVSVSVPTPRAVVLPTPTPVVVAPPVVAKKITPIVVAPALVRAAPHEVPPLLLTVPADQLLLEAVVAHITSTNDQFMALRQALVLQAIR